MRKMNIRADRTGHWLETRNSKNRNGTRATGSSSVSHSNGFKIEF